MDEFKGQKGLKMIVIHLQVAECDLQLRKTFAFSATNGRKMKSLPQPGHHGPWPLLQKSMVATDATYLFTSSHSTSGIRDMRGLFW